MPLGQFLLGLLFFKLRDAMLFGPVWARKSRPRAIVFGLLIAIVTFVGGFGFTAISSWSISQAVSGWSVYLAIAIAVTLTELGLVISQGPLQISDTLWACLDLNERLPTEAA